MFKAYFFDMDGVLFDSMPRHAAAWATVMRRHGLDFTEEDTYLQEGRTGQSVIAEALRKTGRTDFTDEEVWAIYREKSELFKAGGQAQPMAGVTEVLQYLQTRGAQIYIVTGSGQSSLLDTLDAVFPGVFVRERMVTAYDVQYGKPDPEPYLKAWEKTGLHKEDCCVIENAPLGVRSGHAAGLFTVAVNTGPLSDAVLKNEHADCVFADMAHLLQWLKRE